MAVTLLLEVRNTKAPSRAQFEETVMEMRAVLPGEIVPDEGLNLAFTPELKANQL